MTPSPSALAAAADVLGITERTHVVFYDRVGTFSCARAWWVWKAHGHDKCALNSHTDLLLPPSACCVWNAVLTPQGFIFTHFFALTAP